MKWVFYVIVFIYMAYRAVYGAKAGNTISVDKIDYGNDTYFKEGTKKVINCRASSKFQKLEWVDPSGKVIKRIPSNRVYAQEHFVTSPFGGRPPSLGLIFTDLQVKDTGMYQCRSGNTVKDVTLCVMKPIEFIETPMEVMAEIGRSITLSCQAKGDPEPNISWRRNGELEDSTKYKINMKYNPQGYESLLTITSLVPGDSGDYVCSAKQELDPPECYNEQNVNITLHVSHAPDFERINDTKPVYGKINEVVDLVCSAWGFPAPTYRWFKAIEDDTLFEFDQKQIKYSEEDNQSVLSVTASPTTFGQIYKCVASNSYGEAEQYYQMQKIQKPEKPVEVSIFIVSDTYIGLNISWYEKNDFPVESVLFQYLKSTVTSRKPKELEWRKASTVSKDDVDYDHYDKYLGLLVTLEGLEKESYYWIRVKAKNDAGDSPWSEPILIATEAEGVDDTTTESETQLGSTDDKPVAAGMGSDSAFYGIFFAGGIAVVGVVCMFAMRLV